MRALLVLSLLLGGCTVGYSRTVSDLDLKTLYEPRFEEESRGVAILPILSSGFWLTQPDRVTDLLLDAQDYYGCDAITNVEIYYDLVFNFLIIAVPRVRVEGSCVIYKKNSSDAKPKNAR